MLLSSCPFSEAVCEGRLHTQPKTVYSFGPFQVDAGPGELLRNGIRVKLQEQPYQVLLALLEKPGELVTREELRARLWPEDTFVDFEGSLRVAVRKLREALGDEADNPRYIETIPKRGYRFLAINVRGISALDRVVAIPEPGPIAVPLSKQSAPWAVSVGVLLVVVLAGTAGFFLWSRRMPTGRNALVLADFANLTGDAVFDGTLRQGLAVQLEQSPFLQITSEQRIHEILRLMSKPAEVPLTADLAREVCERSGSTTVLDGSISMLGQQYILGLRARNCHSGDILSEQQAQANKKEDVLRTLDGMTSKIRQQLGESRAMVRQFNVPLAEAATPSLEALKAYSSGLKVLYALGDAASIPFFKRATEIDPEFAAAYADLGLAYGAVGESASSIDSSTKAYNLRSRASDAERYMIAATYDGFVTGNFDKALITCQTWSRDYPRAVVPHAYLSGFILPSSGRYEEALAEAQRAISLEPGFSIAYAQAAFNSMSVDRYDAALGFLKQADTLGLKTLYTSTQRFDIAFLQNDVAEMKRLLDANMQAAAPDALLLVHQAAAFTYAGKVAEAKVLSMRAATIEHQMGHTGVAGLYLAAEAVWLAFAGEAAAARTMAEDALRLSTERDAEYGAAFAFALVGDMTRAGSLADDLERRFPEDTSVKFSYVPELRAMSAIAHGNATDALRLLQPGAAYDLGVQGSTAHAPFGAMYAVYVRGQAYLSAHRGNEAVAEFRNIIDHRGIIINDPVGAIAYLQLARAYEISGDREHAKAAHDDFLRLWNGPDTDSVVLRRARAESLSH